jgi:hypothetical protein
MRQLTILFLAGALVFLSSAAYAQSGAVGHFHKVMVSPYIQATFVQGDAESVTINSSIVDTSKFHVEVAHGTLRLYLEGAKDIPHNDRHYNDGTGQSHSLYPDHAVIVTVVYKKMDALSLRGEEKYLCESPLAVNRFRLWVYGESTVIFTQVHISKMHTTIYGESSLDIRSGDINKQVYTCYGEGKINSTAIAGRAAKVTAFGEAEFRVNVSDRIKLTAFGEAKLRYMGNPAIVRGIHFGEIDVKKLD